MFLVPQACTFLLIVVRLLIAAGDDTDSVTREQGVFSALHFAAAANHVEVARLLVQDAGADKSLKNPNRLPSHGNTEIIELLS